jgi:hypothetical protein
MSACVRGIWVQTQEPHEAAREVIDLCRQEGWRLGIWNCDSGMQFLIEQITMPGVTDARYPRNSTRCSCALTMTCRIMRNWRRSPAEICPPSFRLYG